MMKALSPATHTTMFGDDHVWIGGERGGASGCGGAGAGGGAELSRLKWCAHTWSEGSGTAVDDGLHAGRAVGAAAAAIALHGVARAIGCSRPAAVGGRITTGLSLVEPARE